jgi:MFS transporter, PPP family, 3-phenylpropionic acid transporter
MAGDKDHFAEPKPEGFELRLSLLYATLFVPNAVHLAFFPLWLRDKGLSAVEISTLLAAPVLVRIFATPPVTFYADRSPERAHVMIAVSALSLFLSLFLAVDLTFSSLFVLMCLVSAAWSPQVPLADSIALSGVRRFGVEFASIRIWGSVAFLVVNIGAGIAIERFSSSAVPPMIVAAFALVLLAACFMPKLGRRRLLSDAGPVPSGSKSLRRPAVLMFLIATGLIQASHGYLYSFGSIYWKESGIGADLVGFLWAAPVFAEIVLFNYYRRIFGRARPEIVLLVAGGVAVLRWALFPLIGSSGLGFSGFFLAQLLHGLSFGATYLAQQNYLAHAVPEEQSGSAQGLAVFVQGIIMAAVMFASGPLYDLTKGAGFAVMAFIALAGVGLGYWFARLNAKEA